MDLRTNPWTVITRYNGMIVETQTVWSDSATQASAYALRHNQSKLDVSAIELPTVPIKRDRQAEWDTIRASDKPQKTTTMRTMKTMRVITNRCTIPNGKGFPKLGPLPQLEKNPNADLGRLTIGGRAMRCLCGSRVFHGRGITPDGALACECFACFSELEFAI